ncbi:hypothetical protein J7F03_23795 [Streptomyces sp. ISL-43]|uniref:hypothetical protein n=1 Tax=Streptomyces sp. ISL-43 TaxID=2819183 RepID=UPI001BE8B69E|nr:hypothetical protein [Streptomyces sp. ISL-43]MBT2450041.1 hypothetical protein [Streptomyces sp. ISL-43]
MSISVPGALVRNSLALAAEFAAVLLMRGSQPHWLPVMLVLFAFASGLPNGTDAGFVHRTLLAVGAVLIALCGSNAWDAYALPADGRVEPVLWEALTGGLVLIQTVSLTRVSRR